MKPKHLKNHYSGDLSRKFWNAVNMLDKEVHGEMYFAGVLLQDMEEKVIRILNDYIDDGKCSKERLKSLKEATENYYEKYINSSSSTEPKK